MRKLLIIVIGSLTLVSCKSTKGGHCDAYGSIKKIDNSEKTNS